MTTIDNIKDALLSRINALKEIYGAGELSNYDNTAVTDSLAEVLETVNPNHDYPPTPR